MKKINHYEVCGFAFEDQASMEMAEKEAEGIRYIKNRTDMENPDMVLEVYCQMIDQRLFETPVGFFFLYELQEYLTAIPYIKNENIPAIPITTPKPDLSGAKRPKAEHQVKAERSVKKKAAVPVQKQKNMDFKRRFKTSFVINIIFILIMMGMFAITATSGNINIINYENALIRKYELWEVQLNEREETLKQKENKLNQQIGVSALDNTYEGGQGGIIPLEK